MTPTEFYDKYLGYAKIVQSHFKFNSPNIFLAQWALETGWGESVLAKQYNNLAGINYNGVACYRAIGGFAGYNNLDYFVLGYIHVLSINGYGYPEFLATKDGTFAEQAHALGASDWAASHYDNGSGPGSSLAAFEGEFPSTTTDPTHTTTTISTTEPTTTPVEPTHTDPTPTTTTDPTTTTTTTTTNGTYFGLPIVSSGYTEQYDNEEFFLSVVTIGAHQQLTVIKFQDNGFATVLDYACTVVAHYPVATDGFSVGGVGTYLLVSNVQVTWLVVEQPIL